MGRNKQYENHMTDAEIMEVYVNNNKEGISLMVEKYSKYVFHVISKYFPSFYRELDDMYNNGVIGIIKAMQNYNPELGKFSTFATPYIKKELNKHTQFLNGDSSEYFAHLQNSVKKAKNKIEATGEVASVEKIMEETGLSNKIVNREMKIDRTTVSYDVLESYTYDINLSDDFIVSDLLSIVPKETRQIIVMKAIEGKSFTAISKELSKTMFTVKQIYDEGISILRKSLNI